MPRIYNVTLKSEKQITRVCSNCGNQWFVSYEIEAKGSDPRGYDYANQEAKEKLTKEMNTKEDEPSIIKSKNILCEKCNHFSKSAMNSYFKDGYAKGILKIYRESKWGWGCGFLFLLTISALIFLTNRPAISNVMIIFFLVTLILLIKIVLEIISYKRIEQLLKTISEEKLFSVCVENYKNINTFKASKLIKIIKLL